MKTVNVVIDASGSMSEDSKGFVVKYLINSLINTACTSDFEDVEFALYQWGSSIVKIENPEKAKIVYSGKISADLEIPAEIADKTKPMIFISDGGFDKKLKELILGFSLNIMPVYVGEDANKRTLSDIARGRRVYCVTDFVQAVYDAVMEVS